MKAIYNFALFRILGKEEENNFPRHFILISRSKIEHLKPTILILLRKRCHHKNRKQNCFSNFWMPCSPKFFKKLK